MDRTEAVFGLDTVIPENLSDAALFLAVMKNREAYECVLSIIFDEHNLSLKEVKVEEVVLNQRGKRAIRLDAWAKDAVDRQINTEMQNDISGDDIRKRSRFYQSLMDSPLLKSGKATKYRDLPSTVNIFITQEDIFGRDQSMYTFSEQCEELSDLPLNDGTKKLFLNMSSKRGRPELVSLLQYMKKTTLDNPEISVMDERIIRLDEIVREVQNSVEWEDAKMTIYELGVEHGKQIGEKKAEEKFKKAGIQALIETCHDFGVPKDQVADRIVERFQITRRTARRYVTMQYSAMEKSDISNIEA